MILRPLHSNIREEPIHQTKGTLQSIPLTYRARGMLTWSNCFVWDMPVVFTPVNSAPLTGTPVGVVLWRRTRTDPHMDSVDSCGLIRHESWEKEHVLQFALLWAAECRPGAPAYSQANPHHQPELTPTLVIHHQIPF